jgi:PAS domain S-box-containing protein
MGTALLVLTLIVVLCGLMWWGVRTVARHEQALAQRVNEQTVLFQFTNRLHRAASAEEVFESALSSILSALQCQRASILLFDDAGVMRFAASRGLSDSYRTTVEGHSPWKPDAQNPTPISVNDVEHSDTPRELKTVIRGEGIRALAFIPLISNGRLIGKFMAYYDRPHEFTERELEFSVTIARQLALAIERTGTETERRRAEQALRASEERFRHATRAGRVGIWEWDVAANRLVWTDSIYAIHGVSKESFNATVEGFSELIHPEDRQRVSRAIERSLREDVPYELEFRAVRPNGTIVWIFTNAVVFREKGKPVRMIGATIDISERKKIEAELKQARDTAEAASKAKDHFIAMLSHELRTPLTPVVTLLHVLEQDSQLREDARETVKTIQRNLNLEVRLIDDLLDLTRISRGKLTLHSERTDLHELITRAADTCREELRAAGLKLEVSLEASNAIVNGDPVRLQQMLWNLLRNGIKFTPVGGMISITTATHACDAVIRVSDTGVGIAPEAIDRIFRPFEQAASPVARQSGGLGLGLALTRAIVEAHGGKISARSAGENLGSTFTIALPLATTQRVAAASQTPASPQRSYASGNGGAKDLKILLVEDHGDTAKAMSRVLGSFGWRVRTADTVAAALRSAETEPFDLLLCDVGLPDGSGLDLMRQLLRRAGRPLKAIAMSGYGMERDIQLSHEAGFTAHLVKPVNITELRMTIQRVASL